MKCTMCEMESSVNRWDGMNEGWRLIEVYGAGGNKYGAFCGKHSPSDIAGAIKEAIEMVTAKKGKK